jgi:hypothetical protein
MASVAALKRYVRARIRVVGKCWEWQGGKVGGGYGHCRIGQKAVTTHRLAYQLWRGPIRRGWVVRHKCHNPPCCNPRHLLLGTHEDNTLDIVKRHAKRRHLTTTERKKVITMRRSGETVRAIAQALKANWYLIQAAVRGIAGRSPGRPKGSKNMRQRFSKKVVKRMAEMYATGEYTQQQLADKFGCDQTYVSLLVKRALS